MIRYECANKNCVAAGQAFVWDNADEPHCGSCGTAMTGTPIVQASPTQAKPQKEAKK